jgi:uncharacterized protein (DUF2147 family)
MEMIKGRRIRAIAGACALAVALPLSAWGAAEDAIGNWRDADSGGIVSVYSCGGGICVKVVKPGKGREKDDANPNPQLKGRSMAGVVLMNGAIKAGADKWKGKLYNSEDGETYTGYVTSVSKDEVKLEGCVAGGLICKSRTWKRVQ